MNQQLRSSLSQLEQQLLDKSGADELKLQASEESCLLLTEKVCLNNNNFYKNEK